jgi:hypothetical protein
LTSAQYSAGANGFGGAQADGAPQQRAKHVRHGDVLETLLEKDHERAETDAKPEARNRLVAERLQLVCRVADRHYE